MNRFPAMLALVALLALGPRAHGYAFLEEEIGTFTGQTFEGSVLLTDPGGYMAYTYDKDPKGTSTCTAACAQTWPPILAAENERPVGNLTIISRDDGSRQWAYKGKPLYLYSGDAKPGDMKGRNLGNAWRIIFLSGFDM